MLVGALLSTLSASALAASAKPRKPALTWTPGEVNYTIGTGLGASDPVVVNFVSPKQLTSVTFSLAHKLKGFVTVAPNSIALVQPNTSYSVTLTFSIPPKAHQGLYKGTLHIHGQKRALPQALKIAVTVDYAGNVVAPTTHVLSPQTDQDLLSISPDLSTLTFAQNASEVAALKPGSVVILGISTNSPHGFIGKVTSVSKSGSNIVVQTAPASLADAFSSAKMEVSHRNLTSPAPYNQPRVRASATFPLPGFSQSFTEVLFENGTGNVTVGGSVSIDSSLDLGISINPASFTCVDTTTLTGDVMASATLAYSLSDEVPIGTYPLPDFTIWVGWVPVVFFPEIVLSAGVDGSVSAGLSTSATQTDTLTAGMQYTDGSWQPVSSFSETFTYSPPSLSAEASAQGYAEAELNLLVYDIAGPFVDAQPYIEFDVTPLEYWLLSWELSAGFDIGVGVDADVLGFAADYSDPDLISYETPIATGTLALPTPTPTATATGLPTPTMTATGATPTPSGLPTPTATPTVTGTTPTGTATPTPSATATIWPMFHHDPAHTGLSPFDTSSNTGMLNWKFATGNSVTSSPAIGADGTIYFGSYDGNLYAITSGGAEKWTFSAGLSGEYVGSSPAIGPDGTIYVDFGVSTFLYDVDDELYALTDNGTSYTLKWEFATCCGLPSSPTIGADGTIYVSDNSRLYAVNPDGSEKWVYATPPGAYGVTTPAIGPDGTIFVTSWGGYLYAITDGGEDSVTLKWEYPVGTGCCVFPSSPAVGSDGTIYVGSDNDYNVYAVNPDGTLKWTFPTGYIVDSSPAIGADGTIYIGSADDNLYAINPNVTTTCGTSPNTYTCPTKKWAFPTNSAVESSPAIGSDGTIYVGSDDDHLYAVNPSDGSPKWPLPFATGGPVVSSPAIGADGTVYVGSVDDNLYAVAASSAGDSNRLRMIPYHHVTQRTDDPKGLRGLHLAIDGLDRSGTEYRCTRAGLLAPGFGISDGLLDATSIHAMKGWDTNAVCVPPDEDCWY